MIRRTTIEIDEELLGRAKRALGSQTIRATVEEALRRAAEGHEQQETERAQRQRGYLENLTSLVDVDVLAGEDMWR